jgi:hypothetical protein
MNSVRIGRKLEVVSLSEKSPSDGNGRGTPFSQSSRFTSTCLGAGPNGRPRAVAMNRHRQASSHGGADRLNRRAFKLSSVRRVTGRHPSAAAVFETPSHAL